MYDVAIIGTGMGGISAALTLQLHNKKILWLGSENLSSKIRKAERIKNYPGLSSVGGEEFCAALQAQIRDAGLAITAETAQGVYAAGGKFSVMTEKNMYESKTVILATGVETTGNVPGEAEFLGRGVSYCATCDGFLYKDKTIAVLVTDREKEGEVEFLASLAKKVYLIALYKDPGMGGVNVEKVAGMPKRIEGTKRVEKLVFADREIEVDGVFLLKRAVAPAVLVGGLHTENGHVTVGRDMSTNLRGLYAAGDCTGAPYQYTKAAGEGNVAAHSVLSYLRTIEQKENVDV